MFIKTSVTASRLTTAAILLGYACGSVVASEPNLQPGLRISTRSQKLEIGDTGSVLVEFPDWLTRVNSVDPTIIRISAVRPNCLRLECIASGTTKLYAVDRNDRRYTIEVNVRDSTGGVE